MATAESELLTTPMLDSENIDENELKEAEKNVKGTPVNKLKAGEYKDLKEGSYPKGEVAKLSSIVSSSLPNAAGNNKQTVKIMPDGIAATPTPKKQERSGIKTPDGITSTVAIDSANVGHAWVSFDEEGAKKSASCVALLATTQRKGTPLSTVVNGTVEQVPGRTTAANANDGSKTIPISQQMTTKNVFTGSLQNPNKSKAELGTFEIKPENGLISQRIKGDIEESDSGSLRGGNCWVTFDETTRSGQGKNRVARTSSDLSSKMSESQSSVKSSSPAVKQIQSTAPPPQPNWVTFDETKAAASNDLKTTVLEGLSVNISIANQPHASPSTPSPNPFLNAPMTITSKPTPNPFQVPSPLSFITTTNPFHSDEASARLTAVGASPYPGGVMPANEPPSGLNLTSSRIECTPTAVYHDVSILEQSLNSTKTIAEQQVVSMQTGQQATASTVSGHIDAIVAVSEEKPALSAVAEEKNETLGEDFTLSNTNSSWNMLLRFPDKKKRIGSREWKSVVIKLEGNTLQIYEEYELSAPFREIPLQASFDFQEIRLQNERHSKVHTTRLEYLKYEETRSVRNKGSFEHVAEGTPIIKIGSTSHTVMREFIEAVSNSIRSLPAYRDRGITYRKDEVFVDVDDTCHALLDGKGNVKKQGGRVQVKMRAFVTGDPECQLVLNDIVVKEREEARLRGELKPQRVHHWIKLPQCQFHKCVNQISFNESHAITFHPLDACTFELMRFRADLKKPLPLSIKASITLHSEQRIELRAEIQLCQESKMAKYARNNVTFRLPIPETWVPLFRTGKLFGREKSIKSSKGKRAAGIKSRLKHSRCSIAASLGTAKYESQYSAVMWRIDKLPLIQSKVPVDAPQTLTCLLELPSGLEFPDNYQPHAEVQYDVSHVLLSDTTVIAVKVSNKNIPEKWVCYRAFYHYHIEMDVCRASSGPVRDVGCVQQ